MGHILAKWRYVKILEKCLYKGRFSFAGPKNEKM